jgi:hypothetical protein
LAKSAKRSKMFQVIQIFMPPGGLLVLLQMFEVDDLDLHSIDPIRNPFGIAFGEADA